METKDSHHFLRVFKIRIAIIGFSPVRFLRTHGSRRQWKMHKDWMSQFKCVLHSLFCQWANRPNTIWFDVGPFIMFESETCCTSIHHWKFRHIVSRQSIARSSIIRLPFIGFGSGSRISPWARLNRQNQISSTKQRRVFLNMLARHNHRHDNNKSNRGQQVLFGDFLGHLRKTLGERDLFVLQR